MKMNVEQGNVFPEIMEILKNRFIVNVHQQHLEISASFLKILKINFKINLLLIVNN